MGLKVTYAGSEILNLTASAQKTLTTSGKYCTSNIGIDYTDGLVIAPVKDHKTHLYLSIPEGCDLSKLKIPLYWNQDTANGVSVDWGDGGSDSPFTVSGTGNVSAPTPHEYPAAGNYVITMTRVGTTTIKLGNGGSGTGVLGETGTSSNIYRSVLKGFETGDGVTELSAYCCQRYTGLTTVILGEDLAKIGNYCFNYCYGIGSFHWLGPTLPANGDISNTSTWNNVPVWCKIYVPPAYMSGDTPQNIPSRFPSTSTYTYAVEPDANTT